METSIVSYRPEPKGAKWLNRSAVTCFVAIAFGQLLFTLFILLFYYPPTLRGDFAAWNNKPLIDGFIANDWAGNLFFAAHVLMAAILTVGGLAQLVPQIRLRWPAVHRWTGRSYMVCALGLALGGLWLVWMRGTYVNLTGALGISLDAALILIFLTMAWQNARTRRFAEHRRWAIRLFAVASAVWFMRVGYLAWGLATGGAGIGKFLDGPFDLFLAFANSLIPLAVAEGYLRAQTSKSASAKRAMTVILFLSAAIILVGSAGAWMVMWSPYL